MTIPTIKIDALDWDGIAEAMVHLFQGIDEEWLRDGIAMCRKNPLAFFSAGTDKICAVKPLDLHIGMMAGVAIAAGSADPQFENILKRARELSSAQRRHV